MKSKYFSFLFKNIDASILSIYRIVFGAFMFYQMMHYLNIDYTFQLMSGPEVLFNYHYLKFLTPLPEAYLKAIQIGLILSTVLITLGLFYRYAMTFFFLGFSYFTMVDKTLYNNHLYLIMLLAFCMIFMEADKKYSLNWKKKKTDNTVPNWNVRLLQFLFIVVYFYGGLAKLNVDWISGGIPEIMYNASQGSFLHSIFPKVFLVGLITYGGIVYDLLIGFLLLYKPTRKLSVILVLFFNLTNGIILFGDIGLFPYFMICSTILFFDPETIGKFIDNIFSKDSKSKKKKKKRQKQVVETTSIKQNVWSLKEHVIAGCLTLFILFHLIFPFRYHLLADNPEWTMIGSKFAWRMKMQSRKLIDMNMKIIDRSTGNETIIDHTSFLSANQFRHIIEDPFAVVQFAKYLHKKAEERGMKNPIIRADIVVSFNGRAPQRMVDPRVDLSKVDESPFADHDWIPTLEPRE